MALVLGTNCGFVTEAPVADPLGAYGPRIDGYTYAMNHTTPVGAIRITEIGWWCDSATEESNFEVGLYSNIGRPGVRLFVSNTNAKGTTAGWKRVTGLNWAIDAETIYWLAYQLDETSSSTLTNDSNFTGPKKYFEEDSTFLDDPFTYTSFFSNKIMAIYAVVEVEVPEIPMQINIANAWKDVDLIQINIGNVWKDVAEIQQNIGDVWKTVF